MELGLRPGDTLQLQLLPDDARRFRVKMIGFLVHESLIVTAPIDGSAVLQVPTGAGFAVRAFVRDHAIAFKAHVLTAPAVPYAHLHLAYPRTVESVKVRNAVRTDIRREARVTNEAGGGTPGPQAVVVRDLSITGALLESATALGAVGDRLLVEMDLDFDRREARARLPAQIRNAYDGDAAAGEPAFRYGIQFLPMPGPMELVLRAYVFERLATQV